MSERSRRAMVRRVGAGDDRALKALFDSEAGLIAARLHRRGASPVEVEDVLQETFLTVWTKAGEYRGEGAVAAWIWSIARNRWISRQRVEWRQLPSSSIPDPGVAFDDPSEEIDAAAAVAGLSEPMRQVVEAVSIRGLSLGEAAEELGIPEGTIKSRLHRARELLREELR